MPTSIDAAADDDVTLAEWVSHGWKLALFCAGCRAPVAALEGRGIMARFGDSLLATVGDVARRARCPYCGHLGAWSMAMAGVSPEVAVDVPGEPLNNWIARDLYLRHLLDLHGKPLEIADVVWAQIEAFGRAHPHWEPRRPAAAGYPLSAGGARACRTPP